MKKSVLSLLIALMAIVVANAQQISVVSEGGKTDLYRTFQEAIEKAEPGSVIYLPGGGFPIADAVKITKKLTIVGIGNKIDTENPDGYTTVSGNLFFNEGSDFSALMGVYVTGNVYIGNDGQEVDDVLIRHCNINQLQVNNSKCKGITINQNYLRNGALFSGSNATFSNNLTVWVQDLDDGYISNNIITASYSSSSYYTGYALYHSDRTSVTNNIFFSTNIINGSDCFAQGNMCKTDWTMDEDCINIGEADWNNVFENYNGGAISPATDFHFKKDSEYTKYEGQVGIYSGDTPFEDNQLAPVPYIIFKDVPQKTDTEGKLEIRIRVKAGD